MHVKPYVSDKLLEIGKFIIQFNDTNDDCPTPTEIARHFGFTRQAGHYWMKRIIEHGLVKKNKTHRWYTVVKVFKPPFDTIKLD